MTDINALLGRRKDSRMTDLRTSLARFKARA